MRELFSKEFLEPLALHRRHWSSRSRSTNHARLLEVAALRLELGARKGVKGTMRNRKRGKHAQRTCQDARLHAATPQRQNGTHRG